jgi:CDP-diglyceride synthetase
MCPDLSTKLLLFFFIVIFASDVGAYFVGKAIGQKQACAKHLAGQDVSKG